MPRLHLSLLLVLGIASSASAVTMDWTFVGNPGNACDPDPQGCFGAVGDGYYIGTYEVTNAQYAEFLNAVAAIDTNDLYNANMADPSPFTAGGIVRSGTPGSFSYSTIAGRDDMPVNYVSFGDALRFANWMHNGQPTGVQDATTTEDGAYTITLENISDNSITRNTGASVFVTSEHEWYKAAYYDGASSSYFNYPAGTNTPPTCAAPTAVANRANCANAAGDLTTKGSYTGSGSPYGTFDQGGNVAEWTEGISSDGTDRVVRAGSYTSPNSSFYLASSTRFTDSLDSEFNGLGFRVATTVPEPGTGLLVITGLIGLTVRRRTSA